jgi:hypothetical protein
MGIPDLIPIERVEDYHTHYLGKTLDGTLFWGYTTFIFPEGYIPGAWESKRREYAILHLFDKAGTYLKTDYWYAGITAQIQPNATDQKLEEMVAKLGEITFCDIRVKLFQTELDGFVFGLIADEENEAVNLEPSSTISFMEPWDGEYNS